MSSEEENANAGPPRATQGERPTHPNGTQEMDRILGPFRLPPPYIWQNYPPEQLHTHYRDMFQLPRNMQVQQETAVESSRLYKVHLQLEANRRGMAIPPFMLFGTRPPSNMKTLITLAEHFRASPQRRSVFEQAGTVDLESLNFQTFRALLNGLFNEGGITWERVLVLFFFCSDLTLRALYEKLGGSFHRIYDWSVYYMHLVLSFWIEQHGGWEAVLARTIRNTYYKAGLIVATISCLGIIALFAFAQKK